MENVVLVDKVEKDEKSLLKFKKEKCTVGYVYCKELIQHCDKIPNLNERVTVTVQQFFLCYYDRDYLFIVLYRHL